MNLSWKPESRGDLRELILDPSFRDHPLCPLGAGTQSPPGFRPGPEEIAVDCTGLRRIVDYQPADLTVTVEPGVTVAGLQEHLGEHGQFLPLCPPRPEVATLGGTVAAAATGPWRAGFGGPRDWLIGCRVLDAAGREIRGGGQVVKNVAGYDLPKLYSGSFGTLGVLVELTFKVFPRPPATGYGLVVLESGSGAEPLIAAIMDSDLAPTALELCRARDLGEGWYLFAEFQHCREGVDWQVDELQRLAAGVGEVRRLTPEEGARVFGLIRDLPSEGSFACRIGTVSGKVAALCDRIAECLGPGSGVTAHAATGQLHGVAPTGTQEQVDRLALLAREVGARVWFPRLPEGLRAPAPVSRETEIRLHRGIRQALDPGGRFWPGREVPGR